MGDDDVLSALVGGAPTDQQKQAALIQALRGQQQAATLAQMTGDRVLSPFGSNLSRQVQQQAENIGTARQRAAALAEEQAFHQATTEHEQAALEETIRQHNLEHEEKKWQYGIGADGQPDASFDKMVDDIGQLRAPPLNPSATRNPRNFNVMQAVYEKYPGYDGAQWKNKQDTVDAFGKGPQGNLLRSADAGIQHLQNIDAAIDNLHNTPVSFWNQGVNWVKKELGMSVAPTSFDAQKGIVAAEITKFIEGGGTGAGALADRQQLRDDLDSALNPKALHDVVNKWRGLMKGQLDALGNQFQRGTYGTISQDDDKHPFRYLNPATRAALGLPPLEGDAATAAAGGWQGSAGHVSADKAKYKGFSATEVKKPTGGGGPPPDVQEDNNPPPEGQGPGSATPDNPNGRRGRPKNRPYSEDDYAPAVER